MHIKEFLSNNAERIWTLLAMIIGSLVTYKATVSAEKKREKRFSQKEKLKEVMIPYCNTIEDVFELRMERANGVCLQNVTEKLRTPLEFLKADKRVYLSKAQRELLDEYECIVTEFYSNLKKEKHKIMIEYRHWVSTQLMNCPYVPSIILF